MISPHLLMRNIKILRFYDSGKYTRKEISFKLNLSSVHVVHETIRKRRMYELDPRSKKINLPHR